ncbi:MAG TPA: diaminopimelate decarboxylase [Steroidobacteraceae bacterium]|nr:diaminopimelate decarboxylase [Steroidobacteraceae bacterium]
MGESATTAANSVCLTGLTAHVWPCTARLEADGDISVGGLRLSALAARYGTPAYILDEADIRARCRAYADALPGTEIAYAAKAFLCRAMAGWIAEEGLSLDVCSAGELAVARSVGFPADRILLHGNAKTPDDLQAAIDYGVGRVVIDSAPEIIRLAALSRRRQRVLIRVTPGIDAQAHPAVATGMEDQKFGFSLASGDAAGAVGNVLAHPELELAGLHCHIGSQLTRPQAFELATARLVRLMAAVRDRYGMTLPELNLGGGHAVPYVAGDEPFSLAGFADRISRVVKAECAAHRLPLPRLTVEPGRAIVSRAMVTLYRVLAVKHVPGVRTFVAVDGGMSDNPRPALYGARYTVRALHPPGAALERVTVAGRHCEAGDVLAVDVPLPAATRPGDLLVVPGTGAYNHSMASNYNMVGRPPVIAVRHRAARLLVRRETDEDLLLRDVGV